MCTIYIYIIIFIIFLLMCINHYKITENFDTFSPYIGNQTYPYVYEKNKDQAALRSTLKKWELPFNTNNSGYWYTQNKDNPPYVNLNSFEDLKQVRFTVPK